MGSSGVKLDIWAFVNEGSNGVKLDIWAFVNEELKGLDPITFCKDIGAPETYATEFRKMIGLTKLMKEQGTTIKIN